MKKLMMAALVAVASLSANAQIWVGGSLGFNSTKVEKDADAITTIEIAPTVGYKLTDNLDVAVELGFASASQKDADTQTAFKIAPFVRYTALTWDNVSLFVDGGLGYTTWNNERGNEFEIGLRPGVAYTPTEKITLTATLGNLGYTSKSDERGGGSNIGLNLNNALTFGIYFNF